MSETRENEGLARLRGIMERLQPLAADAALVEGE